MFNKTISGIGLVAFAAVLLAGTANTASAAVIAEKAFNRAGAIATTVPQDLAGDLIDVEPAVARATYFADGVVIADPGVNDENLEDPVLGALFDIFVYDVDNTGAENPSLFKNELASVATNFQGFPPPEEGDPGFEIVDFGIANLRFTWYAGKFEVLTSTTAATDLEFSLAAASNTGFFDASNRLTTGCGGSACGVPGFAIATWGITNGLGQLNNTSNFFNYMNDGFNTLLVTGNIIEPGGGGYANIITANQIPLPPAALLFGTALFGIGALRRFKDKKNMAASG